MLDTLRPERVLLVDDDRDVLRSIERVLKSRFRVETCERAEQALVVCHVGGIDAVVSDVTMPGMSGFELLFALKGLYPTLPVLLVTALPSAQDAARASAAGAARYLAKPFTPDELIACLEQVFDAEPAAVERAPAAAVRGSSGASG